MANKSMSAMKNIQEVCSRLRRKYYGDSATASDYKDSFVINNAVQVFPIEACQALMDDSISEKDKADVKISKSINFRTNCYAKLADISKMLEIPEAEALRRILYYSISMENDTSNSSKNKILLSSLKGKVALLRTQIESSRLTLNEIVDEIAQLEEKEA